MKPVPKTKKHSKTLRYLSVSLAVLAITWLMPVIATDHLPDVPPYPLPSTSAPATDTNATNNYDTYTADDHSDSDSDSNALRSLATAYEAMPYGTGEPALSPEPSTPTKLIALTFDDGPSIFTEGILDQLDAYGGHGTFYVVGRRVMRYAHLVERMANTGHEVGNHTWAHERLPLYSAEHVQDTIRRTSDIIQQVTGARPATFRPPYMAFGLRTQWLIADLGYPIVLWSIDTRDWYHRDADIIYNHIMTHASHGDIVLLHDIYESTYEATLRAISSLSAQGFHFVTVSELLGELSTGGVYHGLRVGVES